MEVGGELVTSDEPPLRDGRREGGEDGGASSRGQMRKGRKDAGGQMKEEARLGPAHLLHHPFPPVVPC